MVASSARPKCLVFNFLKSTKEKCYDFKNLLFYSLTIKWNIYLLNKVLSCWAKMLLLLCFIKLLGNVSVTLATVTECNLRFGTAQRRLGIVAQCLQQTHAAGHSASVVTCYDNWTNIHNEVRSGWLSLVSDDLVQITDWKVCEIQWLSS